MKLVTLTPFLDFVSKQGTAKVRTVQKYLASGYDVRTDFYKRLREPIVSVHRDGRPIDVVDDAVDRTENSVKRLHFPAIARGYRHFLEQCIEKGGVEWFAPPRGVWTRGEVRVRVNPELGLLIAGVPHLVKLHFKQDKLRGNRVQVVTHLMREALADAAPPGCVMTALDVRRGKLVAPPIDPSVSLQLDGEVAFWAAVARAFSLEDDA